MAIERTAQHGGLGSLLEIEKGACETWSAGWKRLLKRLSDEVEVLTAMERNRNLHLARLAQLVAPLQERDGEADFRSGRVKEDTG